MRTSHLDPPQIVVVRVGAMLPTPHRPVGLFYAVFGRSVQLGRPGPGRNDSKRISRALSRRAQRVHSFTQNPPCVCSIRNSSCSRAISLRFGGSGLTMSSGKLASILPASNGCILSSFVAACPNSGAREPAGHHQYQPMRRGRCQPKTYRWNAPSGPLNFDSDTVSDPVSGKNFKLQDFANASNT